MLRSQLFSHSTSFESNLNNLSGNSRSELLVVLLSFLFLRSFSISLSFSCSLKFIVRRIARSFVEQYATRFRRQAAMHFDDSSVGQPDWAHYSWSVQSGCNTMFPQWRVCTLKSDSEPSANLQFGCLQVHRIECSECSRAPYRLLAFPPFARRSNPDCRGIQTDCCSICRTILFDKRSAMWNYTEFHWVSLLSD